uniref:Chitin-binding type-2 domain-containing protein n=1 Tax=Panagrolaimus sp. JU765 TaxID=591449 RepID=A0AC34QMY6_9BILA
MNFSGSESSAAYSLPSVRVEKELNDPGRPYPVGARPFPAGYPPQIPTDPYLPQPPPPAPQPMPQLPVPTPQQPYFPQIELTTPPLPAGPKPPYEINFCDKTEFPDSTLAQYSLERIDYFIYNKSCSGTFYQCSIGQTFLFECLTKDQAFDPSIVNCNYRYDNRICPEYDHILHCSIKETCTENQFACCASPQKCIDLSQVCNGVADCADEEDEHNCPSCAKDEFACVKSGRCIPAALRCNGQPDDCQDSSNLDEIGCSKNTTCWGKFICNSPQTIATLGRSECIDYELHCNGVKEFFPFLKSVKNQ